MGKSYWIRRSFPEARVIDLLQTDAYADYASRPSLLRERLLEAAPGLVVIDEVQKIPALLDEVHWLIENTHRSFLLTGSSARKLRRGHANLLAGRARRYQLVPLCHEETGDFDLERAMLSGFLPSHFLSEEPLEDLRSYVADYLKEEIAAEALTRNIPAFSEFLRVAAITSSELLNYTNVGREAGVSPKVVRTYFEILEDTYLGYRVPPWRKAKSRRLIESEKFYLFDTGVTNFLARRRPKLGSAEIGKSFEQYILMELKAYQAYRNPDLEIAFWRTASGIEVDFIVGEMELAIEVKASRRVHAGDVRPLLALAEEHRVRRSVIVSFEAEPRRVDRTVEVLPWRSFLQRLWSGDLEV